MFPYCCEFRGFFRGLWLVSWCFKAGQRLPQWLPGLCLGYFLFWLSTDLNRVFLRKRFQIPAVGFEDKQISYIDIESPTSITAMSEICTHA